MPLSGMPPDGVLAMTPGTIEKVSKCDFLTYFPSSRVTLHPEGLHQRGDSATLCCRSKAVLVDAMKGARPMISCLLPGCGSWGVERHGRVTTGGARGDRVLAGVPVRSSWRLPARQPGSVRGSARPN